MSTRYEEFLPEVLPYVPECPEIVAVNAICNACIEFCDKSHWWLYEHDPLPTTAYVRTYQLDVPDFTQVCRIVECWYDNYFMRPAGEDELRKLYTFDWRIMEGSPRYFTHSTPDEITVVPMPIISMAEGLKLIVAPKPTRDSFDVDDTLYNRWAEQIGMGARARIHEIPGQTFSDPAMALKYRTMFNSAIGRATEERQRGLTRGTLRVRPPRFF